MEEAHTSGTVVFTDIVLGVPLMIENPSRYARSP